MRSQGRLLRVARTIGMSLLIGAATVVLLAFVVVAVTFYDAKRKSTETISAVEAQFQEFLLTQARNGVFAVEAGSIFRDLFHLVCTVPSGWGATHIIESSLKEHVSTYGVDFTVPDDAIFGEISETHWTVLLVDAAGNTRFLRVDHAAIAPLSVGFICRQKAEAVLQIKSFGVQGQEFVGIGLKDQ